MSCWLPVIKPYCTIPIHSARWRPERVCLVSGSAGGVLR